MILSVTNRSFGSMQLIDYAQSDLGLIPLSFVQSGQLRRMGMLGPVMKEMHKNKSTPHPESDREETIPLLLILRTIE